MEGGKCISGTGRYEWNGGTKVIPKLKRQRKIIQGGTGTFDIVGGTGKYENIGAIWKWCIKRKISKSKYKIKLV